MLLRAVTISPDAEIAQRLQALAGTSGLVEITRTSEHYLKGYELERFLRAQAPDFVLLSMQSPPDALEVIAEISKFSSSIPIAAVDRRADPALLVELMRAGVREMLHYPVEKEDFVSMAVRFREMLEKQPDRTEVLGSVYAFLPAKAGVGTSTIALNTAIALASRPDSSVLIVDMDLNAGIIGFMLKLTNPYTVYEAIENASKLDEDLWPQIVTRSGSIDVLPAGRLDLNTRIQVEDLRALLSFARRFYRDICIDLSGNLERFSIDIMHEAKKVFLVTTPEIPALHLARQKIHLLRQLELMDHTLVLLNRSQRRMIVSREQIEELLGVPIHLEFPNDYRGANQAVTEAAGVDSRSELGRQFRRLADSLTGSEPGSKNEVPRKRFLEFFAVGGARGPLLNEKS